MFKLTREKIRRLAGSDVVYAKGLRYYKEGKVSKALYSSKTNEYKFTVIGSYSYMVSITADSDMLKFHCNCPAHVTHGGACKHIIASLLFLNRLIQKSEADKHMQPDDKKAYQVLEYMSNQFEIGYDMNLVRLEVSINIQTMLKDESSKAEINLRIGSERLYKIQSLKRFFNCYSANEKMFFGKECRFVRGETKLDKTSQEVLDFLYELYLTQYKCIQEFLPSNSSEYMSSIFTKTGMLITKQSLIRLLKILGNEPFKLTFYGRPEEKAIFKNENPHIRYDIDYFEDTITLDYYKHYPVCSMAGDGSLLYYQNALYTPDETFSKYYLPFYNSLGNGKAPLVFRDDNRQRFMEELLPMLHDTMEVDIPDFLSDKYISLPFSANLYLEPYYETGIKAILIFKYGDYEFNAYEQPDIGSNILVREKEAETELFKLLFNIGFYQYQDAFLLTNDDFIYNFLNTGLEQLSEACDIFYSKDFGKFRIRKGNRMRFSMHAGDKIDLLEVSLDIEDIEKEELLSIIKAYQVKKEFIRLKDGSFFKLKENKELEIIEDFLDDLNISLSEINNDSIKLTKKDIFYMEALAEKMPSEINISFEKNDIYNRLVERITSLNAEDYVLPKTINADIRPYQITGYRWLRMLADNYLGGILADEMGLGKTLQAILYITGVIEKEPAEKPRFLIVCPTSLIFNWVDEFNNFAPGIKVNAVVGQPADREQFIRNLDADVLVTSYPLLRNDILIYKLHIFNTVFLDEAQSIKNFSSLNAKSVKQLRCEHRFALTGTPMENSLSELWSVFDFLMPGFLSSHSKFVKEFEFPIVKGDTEKLTELNKRLGNFILRRLKKDVLTELPEKIEEKMIVDMTDEQTRVYMSYVENLRNDIQYEISTNGIEKSGLKILAAVTRLRQLCCHPSVFLENYRGGSGKLQVLLAIVKEALANGHRMLIFSQFTTMLAIIKNELDAAGYSYFYLDGKTDTTERLELVKQFNQGEADLFLISLKAGGTGLNLTGADMVVHYDPWWNPAVEEQAEDRAHRIGQDKNVHVIRLITKGTIEEKIYKLQTAKKNLSDSIIKAKESFITSLSLEEIEDLFR